MMLHRSASTFRLVDPAITDASGRAFAGAQSRGFADAKSACRPAAESTNQTYSQPAPSPVYERTAEFPLNPQYTFDNFVVGPAIKWHMPPLGLSLNRRARSSTPFFHGGTALARHTSSRDRSSDQTPNPLAGSLHKRRRVHESGDQKHQEPHDGGPS